MDLCQEADRGREIFMKVDKEQLKIHGTHKNIF